MCKHQQPKVKATALTATNIKDIEVKAVDKCDDFFSCGLDKSCPKSVTTYQGQGVRLYQYQSSIRDKTDKRRRQKKIEGELLDAKSTNPFNPSYSTDYFIKTDHEFEWYDLDAIGELDSGNSNNNCAIIVSHDFHAGLIFTTERQVLNKKVEVNVVNPSIYKKENKSGQEFEFNLFFWVNSDHNEGETPDEREFRERMEELEVEVKSDLSPLPPSLLQFSPSFSSSLSASSSMSSSDHSETKNQNDSDDSGHFFVS